MKTKLLYLEDCYKREFESEAIEVLEDKGIILRETLFYPLSGGQPSDRGRIINLSSGKEYNIKEVVKRKGEVIHYIEGEHDITPGRKIKGIIDWDYRYKLMRMHTAAHLLSSLIFKKTNAKITGNQLGFEKSRIDFDLENFDRELFKKIEDEANELIKRGAKVKKYFLPKKEAFKIPEIVKLKNVLPPSIQEIRIVEIEGIDIQACGGTHVDDIKEIGRIEIIKMENKGKNNRRIYYVVE